MNEKTDSFAAGTDALKAFSGYDDDRMFKYGGTLTYSGKYSRSDYGVYNIIPTSGGTAGEIINGTAEFGHGLLSYGTINTLFIKGIDQGNGNYVLPGNVDLYDASQYKFNDSGSIIPKGSDSNGPTHASDLNVSMNPDHYALLSIALTDDLMANVPDGWTLVTVGSSKYFIDYITNFVSVDIANENYHNG